MIRARYGAENAYSLCGDSAVAIVKQSPRLTGGVTWRNPPPIPSDLEPLYVVGRLLLELSQGGRCDSW